MGTVATLAVNVIARTGDFNKGLDKAGKKAKGFGKSVSGSTGGMSKMIPVAAAAAAGIAVIGVAMSKVSQQMKRLDAVAKKARTLGISGQDLMGFQHAAQLAGVEADSFSRAMMDMQKNIGDAMAGTGEAKDALAMIGLEIKDLAQMDASEQFLVIADKIAKIENAAERAAVAARVFGGAGADLIPMLTQGSEAIREQMAELERLQGVISELEFQGIEGANDAMDKIGKSIDGIWMNIAVLVAPLIEMIANGITAIIAMFKSWNNEMDGNLKYFVGVYGILLAIHDLVDLSTGGSLTKASNEAAKAAREAEANLEKHKITMAEEAAIRNEQIKQAEELAKAREHLVAQGASLTESLRNPMEQFTDTIDNLNMMLGEGVISWKTYGRAVARAQDNIKQSDKFRAKEIKVAERQSVGAAIRGQAGTFSIQQKQQRALEKIREEERLQTQQLKEQTSLLKQLNKNVQTGTVVTI
jgi:hypothetical protein